MICRVVKPDSSKSSSKPEASKASSKPASAAPKKAVKSGGAKKAAAGKSGGSGAPDNSQVRSIHYCFH